MVTSTQTAAGIYTDFNGIAALRKEAKDDSPEALQIVAKQFESIFMQMMLKSMREASLGDGIFDNEQSAMYTDMYDKQLSTSLSGDGHGIGLAEIMVRQLRASQGIEEEKVDLSHRLPERQRFNLPVTPAKDATDQPLVVEVTTADQPLSGKPDEFVKALLPHAEVAARRLGVEPKALLAQVALETGWGRSVIRHPDGSSSHNLFNIKADGRWSGEAVSKPTLEYRDGIGRKEQASFRAYDGYAASFNDYVDFIQGNPRYQQALANTDQPERYIEELQRAGYATDPDYSNKINRIIGEEMPELMAGVKLSAIGTLSNG